MPEPDRATWRKNAEECVDLARITTDGDTKRALLVRAQEWLKLAYSEGETEFERILSAFNKQQMAFGTRARLAIQRTGTQQQRRRPQQSKPDNNGSSQP
jgi:hypothetical protein